MDQGTVNVRDGTCSYINLPRTRVNLKACSAVRACALGSHVAKHAFTESMNTPGGYATKK